MLTYMGEPWGSRSFSSRELERRGRSTLWSQWQLLKHMCVSRDGRNTSWEMSHLSLVAGSCWCLLLFIHWLASFSQCVYVCVRGEGDWTHDFSDPRLISQKPVGCNPIHMILSKKVGKRNSIDPLFGNPLWYCAMWGNRKMANDFKHCLAGKWYS